MSATSPSGDIAAAARLCVFTTLTGRYEKLNEQPVAAESGIPFLCLTDDPALRSETWQTRLISPLFGMDPVRSQREFKIRPHVHLSEFDASLYIDNSVVLKEPPERVFERYCPASGFCLPRHSFRDTVLEEFVVVSKLGLDDQNRIFEQLSHYSAGFREVLEERPYWTGILVRDHRHPLVCEVMDIWAAHVCRYCRRDQLSINAALRQAGLTPDVMEIDNADSWFHSWPHRAGRSRAAESRARDDRLSSVVARYREIDRRLAEELRRQEAPPALPTWRVAALLSGWSDRHPRLARFAWWARKRLF